MAVEFAGLACEARGMTKTAIIFGASGGIGAGFVTALKDEGNFDEVIALSRSQGDFDLADETSIAAAASRCTAVGVPGLIIIATGLLHSSVHSPEKSYKETDPTWMAENYALNTIGPALIAKHFLPLLSREERCVIGFLSARVGSNSDNLLGGWHSYRASKAALNMLVKNYALELARTHKRAVCVALHPGTVDTALSKPFQGNVAPGKLFDQERAALQLLDVIDGLRAVDSGKIFAWDGEEIQP
jgi:NAD(P)-dependent dehydrogenase (short-subunit alcohol dehydrogenase family)